MSESIRRRYLSKIGGNIGSGIFTLLTQSLLSRILGPSAYGQLIFVQAHFESLFTDFGLSTTLFTKISQDKRSYPGAAALFLVVVAGMMACVLVYVASVFLAKKNVVFWPEIFTSTVWLGGALVLTTYLARTGVLLVDAAGYASKVEIARCYRAVLTVLSIGIVGYFGKLSLSSAIIILLLWQLSFLWQVIRFGHLKMGGGSLDFSPNTLRCIFKEIRGHAAPLICYSVFNIFVTLFDRWLLQLLSGSTEQSYFGLAYQISTALFLATCAMTYIFQREVALAFAQSDWKQLKELFHTYLRRIFAIAAVPCVFVSVHSATVAELFGGQRFSAAGPTLALMALQPIIQGAGQLSVAFQYAMNRTKLYAATSICRDIVGFPLSVLLLGNEFLGVRLFHLGAPGLAIKSLFVIATTTYVFHYANCKILGISFLRHLGKELGLLLPLGMGALLAHKLGSFWLPSGPNALFLALSGIIYLSVVLGIFWLMPRLFGFENSAVFRQFALQFRRPMSQT